MAKGASVNKSVLFASGKVGGKAARWPVAVFVNLDILKGYAGTLKLAYATSNVALVKAMDPMSPEKDAEKIATDVKLTAQILPYNPQPPALDDEIDVAA